MLSLWTQYHYDRTVDTSEVVVAVHIAVGIAIVDADMSDAVDYVYPVKIG